MAVAFILGLYLGFLVQALVNDLIMPIIQLVLPNSQWQTIAVGPFQVGAFAGAVLTFIIIALVIFMMVKFTAKMNLQ